MAIKFIALDTNGTLLDSNGKILPSTKIAVKKALEQGIKVALCSGRPIAGLKHFMDKLGIVGSNQYAVTLNGAITRTADGQVMTEDLVS
ncbi:HAD hydrolase family protein, partial [Lactobacillus helveticus]